jgi:hypothetical protein
MCVRKTITSISHNLASFAFNVLPIICLSRILLVPVSLHAQANIVVDRLILAKIVRMKKMNVGSEVRRRYSKPIACCAVGMARA